MCAESGVLSRPRRPPVWIEASPCDLTNRAISTRSCQVPLPIILTYRHQSGSITRDIPGLSRIRDVLGHHRDRVREISFQGTTGQL